MIMVDGLRHDAIEKTNFYRKLKKNSTFFSRLITYAPYTIGSLHSLFSGMNGNRNGVNGYYKSYSFDKKGCFTIAQYMKEQGYHTETDLIYESIIPNQGFDKVRTHNEFEDDLLIRHEEILKRIKHKKPFFLFLDYSKLHTHLVLDVIKKYSDFDKEYFKNFNKNFERYLGWVKDSGDYVGKILDKIKEEGLWNNTDIIIFSDHGSSVGDKLGEKAYGVYLYEYTLRSSLYLIGKRFPKNLQVDSIIRHIDVLPTLLDLLKVPEKKDFKKIQGKSFLPFIDGKTDDRICYSETGGLGGPTPSPERHNVKSVRTNKWKLIYNETTKKKELYDLETDPKEENNVIRENKEIEKVLWEEIQKQDSKL